jgi:hypothetical protein
MVYFSHEPASYSVVINILPQNFKNTAYLNPLKEVYEMPKKEDDKKIKILVLDVLKPHKPNIVEFGEALSEANGIDSADVSVYAVDERTESVKVVLEGKSLDFEAIKKTVEDFGAVIHSVDKVCLGKRPCAYALPEVPHARPL